MENSGKESNKAGCIVIAFLLVISWGLPSLIRGNGFFNGIRESIEAGIYLGIIALIGYVFYKTFLNK